MKLLYILLIKKLTFSLTNLIKHYAGTENIHYALSLIITKLYITYFKLQPLF